MPESPSPKRCPDCGATLPAGLAPLLCPSCTLTEADGPQLGNYTLLGEIARGGMGVVYRARQESLNRTVAITVLPGAAFASEAFRARFQREAETGARLHHPGIVAIHEIGETSGQPFIAMEFIEGRSLAERLQESRLASAPAARLVRGVALAVAHAHSMGVAHRDLKPSNILLAENDRPILTDFGLAHFLEADGACGLSVDLTGTPPYLPPERLSGNGSPNDTAGDIYGLGAVLYHCLTGRPPFQADSLAALLAAVSAGDPVPPRRLNHSVPKDLETICLKCLAHSPAARYGKAAGVAEELDRFLLGQPILARPLSPAVHFLRTLHRHPLSAALAMALLFSILAGTFVSLLGWSSARKSEAAARAIAETRRVELYSGNLAAASAALDSGNRARVRQLLDECRPAPGESDLRGAEWFVASTLIRPQELASIPAHHHILTALAWNPSGDTLLSAANDGSLRAWRLTAPASLTLLTDILPPGSSPIRHLQWFADGRHFLTADDTAIRCRSLDNPSPLWEIPGRQFSLAEAAGQLAVSLGSPFYYEPEGEATLWVLNPDTACRPVFSRQIAGATRQLALSSSGRWLASSLPENEHHDDAHGVRLEDLSLPRTPARILPTSAALWSLDFSPDGQRLLVTTTSETGRVECFDTASGNAILLAAAHAARVWSVTFVPGSLDFLTTSSDRSLRVWTETGGVRQILPLAHDNEIWTAAIHPAGHTVASGDKDGILKLFVFPLPPDPATAFARHPHFRYTYPCFTADSHCLLVQDPAPAIWEPRTNSKIALDTAAFPAGLRSDGIPVVLDPANKTILIAGQAFPLPPRTQPLPTAANASGIIADGTFYYQFSSAGFAAVLNLNDGTLRQTSHFCPAEANVSALSPDGRYLAAATWKELHVHDFLTGKTTVLPNEPHWAKAICFTPDGNTLITGGVDSHIILRRLPDLSVIQTLTGHQSEVSGLAVSPDGRTLVSSEIGIGLRFWRLDTLREVFRLPMPRICERLVFAPDGQTLAAITCPPASPPAAAEVVIIPCLR